MLATGSCSYLLVVHELCNMVRERSSVEMFCNFLRPLDRVVLTVNLSIVFGVPQDLLYHFVYSIVKDWRFEQWTKWEENEVFVNGVHFGYKEKVPYSPALKTGSFGYFVGSLASFPDTIGSDAISESVIAAHSNTAELVPKTSEGRREASLEIAPVLSTFQRDEEPIKQEPEAADVCQPGRCYNASESEKSILRSQGRQWKKVEGCGPFVFAYV